MAVFFGAQAGFDTVWNLADVLMALMAMVNIIAIFLLGRIVVKTLDDYTKQKKEKKDPIFHPKEIGIENTEAWD